MIEPNAFLLGLANLLTESINPIFVALILEEPLLVQARQKADAQNGVWRHTTIFWARAFLSVGTAVVLAELGKKYQVWPGHPGFPSGHTTLAAAAATALILQRGRVWGYIAVPLTLLMAVGIVYGRWHTPDEVLAALLLGPVVVCGLWRLTGGRFPGKGNTSAR